MTFVKWQEMPRLTSMFSYPTIYFDDPPQPERAIDLWIPQAPVKPVALYFIHGGGWKLGHRGQMHQIMYGFYCEGYPCVSVSYGLKDATVVTQLSDVREGLSLAGMQLKERGLAEDFVLYGSSAGGHLALLAGLAGVGTCGEACPAHLPAIAGIIASCAPTTFEPWDNMLPESWSCIQNAAGIPYADNPVLYQTLSPAFHGNAQSPPLLFLLGECEHMFPNKQTISFAERLQALGCPVQYHIYEQAEHGFFYDLTRPAQRKAYEDILSFLGSLPLLRK